MATGDTTLMRLLREADIEPELYSRDIPEINLYIDQILTLFNQRLAEENGAEPPMTKTMIHNYSKSGLIQRIKGKKYAKEHILQMLLIYQMKSTLTMQEIKTVMDALCQSEELNAQTLAASYDRFLEVKGSLQQRALELAGPLQELLAVPQEDRLVTLLTLCTLSRALRQLSQRVIAECFAPVPQPERERKSKG